MKEIFKPIFNCEGLYEVSNQGVIKNVKTGRTLVPHPNYNGYLVIGLRFGSARSSSKLVHRVVWEAFNGPVPAGLQINHINEDKTDNRLENLELVTPSKNIQHSVNRLRGYRGKHKSVVKIDAEGRIAGYYANKVAAGKAAAPDKKRAFANIDAAIKTDGTAYGYKWKYFDDLSPIMKLAIVAMESRDEVLAELKLEQMCVEQYIEESDNFRVGHSD